MLVFFCNLDTSHKRGLPICTEVRRTRIKMIPNYPSLYDDGCTNQVMKQTSESTQPNQQQVTFLVCVDVMRPQRVCRGVALLASAAGVRLGPRVNQEVSLQVLDLQKGLRANEALVPPRFHCGIEIAQDIIVH